jgi:hypothetical protein
MPDSALLADCPEPVLVGDTNRALGQLAIAQKRVIKACNADKAALREFYKKRGR